MDDLRKQQGKRLRQARIELDISQKDFAASVDVQPGSYSDIENGKNKLSAEMSQKIASKHKININWVLTGEGGMFDRGKQLLQDVATAPMKIDAAIECFSEILAGLMDDGTSAKDIMDKVDVAFKAKAKQFQQGSNSNQ
jgi:transcriptional regulator with XRE-family HTH domain